MNGLEKFRTEINAEVDTAEMPEYARTQADVIIEHLEAVCDEEYDALLNQPHKSFKRMWSFVVDKAREREVNGCACVSDATVFGWIDEYVGLDDKAEVEAEEKAIEKATTTKPAKKTATTKPNKKAEPSVDVDERIKQIQDEVHKRHEISDAKPLSIFDLM